MANAYWRTTNYNIYRKDRFPITSYNPRRGTFIAIRKDIPAEDISQSLESNILSITPILTIGAAYVSSKTRIFHTDIDNIISPPRTDHFLIGENFNVKHRIWNNINRNANGSTIKNHSELITKLSTIQPIHIDNRTRYIPINVDIFFSVPFLFNCRIIYDLPSNHLPQKGNK